VSTSPSARARSEPAVSDAVEPTQSLSAAERDRLAEYERTTERGLGTFVEVGRALLAVRDSRLYRADYPNFDVCCRERWSIGRSRADQLIEAATTVTKLLVNAPDAPTPNSKQAGKLARVPEPERAEVWWETVERTEGRPTAAAVRAWSSVAEVVGVAAGERSQHSV
jgi:hypothetical protein